MLPDAFSLSVPSYSSLMLLNLLFLFFLFRSLAMLPKNLCLNSVGMQIKEKHSSWLVTLQEIEEKTLFNYYEALCSKDYAVLFLVHIKTVDFQLSCGI